MLGALPQFRDSKRSKRRDAMLSAAHVLFVEKGYEATTVGDIIHLSGGSLATLYDFFENKPGLLRALVRERSAKISLSYDRAVLTDQPPEVALRRIAEEMFDRLLDPIYVGLFRVVIAQRAAQPDLVRQLYDAGPAASQGKVAEYLSAHSSAEALKIDDPVAASQMFYHMTFGTFHDQIAFGFPVTPSVEDRSRFLDRALWAFIKIYES